MSDSQFPSDPPSNFVLDELRVAMVAAEKLADDLAVRFANGDSAPAQIAELADCLTVISSQASKISGRMSDEIGNQLSSLVNRLFTTASCGESWMNEVAGPRLAELNQSERLRRVYRLPP